MKVALIYDAVYPFTKGGGEKVFFDIATSLSNSHEIHLFGMKFWEGGNVIETRRNIFHHAVCKPKAMYNKMKGGRRSYSQALKFALYLPSALHKAGSFDVIDCMSTPYLHMFPAFLYAKYKKIPFISSWLELWTIEQWLEHTEHRFSAYIAKFIEQHALTLPDHFIANSAHTKNRLIQCGVSSKNITTINPSLNGKEVEKSEPDKLKFDLIFIGRLIKPKGVDKILYSIKLLRKNNLILTCRIIGDGPEKQTLERLSRDLEIRDQIRFDGRIDNVYGAMKSAKICCLLSEREGFGIVVIEAAACGIPTITINTPNNAAADLVSRCPSGSVCSDNIPAIAEAIKTLIKKVSVNPNIKVELVNWSRSFDIEITSKMYESEYIKHAQSKITQ